MANLYYNTKLAQHASQMTQTAKYDTSDAALCNLQVHTCPIQTHSLILGHSHHKSASLSHLTVTTVFILFSFMISFSFSFSFSFLFFFFSYFSRFMSAFC